MAARGLRVLALARRHQGQDETLDETASTQPGPARPGRHDRPAAAARHFAAVRTCHAAGITVKMITGDHAETARHRRADRHRRRRKAQRC
jgi:cation-transporting ATPase F